MSTVDRRDLLGWGLAGLAATAASATSVGLASQGTANADSLGPLTIYDLTHLYALDLGDPAQAARAYDELHLVATLQGIVNRDAPRLYVRFVTHDEMGQLDLDEYWLDVLRAPGGLLAGRDVRTVGSLDDLIASYARDIAGAVIWDPSVPSTSNVASTVAGADDLVAIRYDRSAGSLYERYVSGGRITARVRLLAADGSSLFTGSGTIPGTPRRSSGSAKCDAYLWAIEHYLKPGRSVPEFGYYLDGYWLHNPLGKLQQALLTNHDYLVARRGFFFDLSPWDDEAPADDPGQPLGADSRTLQEILRIGYDRRVGGFSPVKGFVPWGYKYTSLAPGGSAHDPVATEWRYVQLASAYNSYLDADAENLDAMANASVYRHARPRRSYPQPSAPGLDELRARSLVDAAGRVIPKRYVMFYVGDYDSAAWLYHVLPRFWDDPARGSVPLNWAFDPDLAERIPIALDLARRTATPADTFVAGDSGAGYLNPGMLQEPREFSGLPSGVDAWRRLCARAYDQWGLSVTGFVIDGFAPGMNAETLKAYASFSTGGFAAQKIDPIGLVGRTPFVRMGPDLPRGSVADGANALRSALQGDLTGPPPAPEFHSVRTILMSPSWHRDVVASVRAAVPDAAFEIVDAHTFYTLVRQSQRT